MKHRLILASASPQRERLLKGLGLTFEIIPSAIDESQCTEGDPAVRARVLAEAKARDIAARHLKTWVIGCDTLVVSPSGELFEKAADAREARAQITAQSGKTSVVYSGLSLIAPDGAHVDGVSSSQVTFKRMTEREIDWWIDGGFWKDRSGSFQIDGPGQLIIAEIHGDWSSVVGFPVFLFGQLCEEAGAPFVF